MGKSRAEVQKLASEGKLTSKILFESINSASGKISESFKKMPLTFGQSMTLLQNSVLKWVSEINTSTGIVGGLLKIVEIGINKIIDFLKTPVEMLNYISDKFGNGNLVDTSGWKVDLSDFRLEITQTENDIKDRLGNALTEAFNQDYIKTAIDGTFSYLVGAGDRYLSKLKEQGDKSTESHRQNENLRTQISEKAAQERIKLLEKYMPEIKIRNELQKQLREINQLHRSGLIGTQDAKYISDKARWDSAYELADVAKEKAVSFEDKFKGTYDPAQDEMNRTIR
ncbi:hypothetical protein I926_09585 [Pasteurella multocida subsp. multocida OH4807]|nr:hypothetical protein I926_09585 [Pasteurella multocida subsp. multocida OH4807]